MTFWECFWYVLKTYPVECCDLVIEDPSQNLPAVFEKTRQKIVEKHGKEKAAKLLERVAESVGRVKGESELLIMGFRDRGYFVYAERPTSAKWDDRAMERYTKYSKRCSQHAKDAAKLCFGIKAFSAAAQNSVDSRTR